MTTTPLTQTGDDTPVIPEHEKDSEEPLDDKAERKGFFELLSSVGFCCCISWSSRL
jgi:hypothetical protein